MNNQVLHLIATVAGLAFCAYLYASGGREAALVFAGSILGYWFGAIKVVLPTEPTIRTIIAPPEPTLGHTAVSAPLPPVPVSA